MELLSRLVCQLTISLHTFLGMTFHVVGPRRNTQIFRALQFFSCSLRNFWIQTWFCNCPQYLCLFHMVVEYIPGIHDQGKMLVLPNQLTSLLSNFHIGSRLCFVPANFMSSTYADKNNPFSQCTNKHFQLATFSQPYFNGIYSNCLSHNSPAKG